MRTGPAPRSGRPTLVPVTVAPTATPSASRLERLRPRWTHRAVVANLVAQIGIVVTGGAVRLTGSGLGCSTWPQCEPGRFTPELHAAMGIHPLIEFGNRTLTFVLVVLAAAVALLVGLDRSRSRRERVWGWVPIVGVVVQAVVGGITVLVDLHPAVVGSHFMLSMVLVAASTWVLVRTREPDGPVVPVVGPRTRLLAGALALVGAVVLALGVVVTGAGPHSGDEEVGYRFAVDPYLMARVHAASVWLFTGLVALTVAVLVRARRVAAVTATADRPAGATTATVERALRSALVLTAVTLGQGLVGYVQFFTGLPIALVNLHMLGAAVLTWAIVAYLGTLRVPVRSLVPRSEPSQETGAAV